MQKDHKVEEKKMLGWLLLLDQTAKHADAMLLKQPDANELLLKEPTVLDWLGRGSLV
jgi:hypothetical protein